ncbi:MAG: carboxypeptidase regulatory-like domain-containing protein [Blastocatellales bacterium]
MKRRSLANALKNTLSLICCAIALVVAAPLAYSQENAGSIQGVVKDDTGAAIPGAKVTASSSALVRPIEVVTDGVGAYNFPRLPVGIYSITVNREGFKTVKKEEIAVQLGKELTLEIALPAGNVSEQVNITATAEALDITSSRTATNLTEQFIDNTPRGRNFHSILKAAPGVRPEPKGGNEGVGGIQVDGASGAENAFILDGVEVTDVRKGQLRRADSIPFEFIREVQVKSGGFEAEYGGATGGVVNVVTKSGSNEFHGEGAFLFTNSALNSQGRGYWQPNRTNPNVAEFFRAKEDDYRAFFPGFSLGGPVLKDRLHFFTSYFPEVIRTERTINFAADNSTKTFTQDVKRHYGIGRLDYAPTQKLQINTSYIWTPTKVNGLLPIADGRVAAPTNDQSVLGGYTPSNAYTAAVTYTPTSKLVLSARYGYKYLNDKGSTLNGLYTATNGSYGLPAGPYLWYRTPTSSQTNPPVPASLAGNTDYRPISSTFAVLRDITTRHNVYLDGTYIARAFGQQHTLKAGYALNRLANDVDDNYLNGRFDIYWGEAFTRGTTVNQRGAYGYYIWEDGVRHNAKVNSRNQGFYIQDAWQLSPRINLNLGVRFENEFLPPYTKTYRGAKVENPISFGWGDKIAPRLGFAWDVLGTGKWKLSASYGHYYDVMKYEIARGSFGGDYWVSHVYKLDDPTKLSALSKGNPTAVGSLITEFDNRTLEIDSQGRLLSVDPNVKPYEQREFTVTSTHQFASNLVFSARYTRKRLMRALEDIGVLDADENEVYITGNPGFGLRDRSISALSGQTINLKEGQYLVPRAKRQYDGLEFRLDGRFNEGFARNFSYFVSYTYSRLYGNYAGLANSDENGRSDPGASRAFDLPYINFDSKGNNVYGPLGTDRPHSFTFFGNYDLRSKLGTTNFSLSQVAYSGTPLTSEATVIVPVFFNGRGDLGRSDTFTQTDILIGHTINVTERVKIKLDMNVQNLFNQAAVMNVRSRLNRNGNAVISDQQFFGGFDVNTLFYAPGTINPATGQPRTTQLLDPTYGLPGTRQSGLTPEGSNAYQGIRELRFGFRVIF